jgi:hypothetical protein
LAAAELANCIETKAAEGSGSHFNLALRALIRLCNTTVEPTRWAPDGVAVQRELIRALSALAANEDRSAIPTWVTFELHDLIDNLSIKPFTSNVLWDYLTVLSALKVTEINSFVSGDLKKHAIKGACHYRWQKPLLGYLSDADQTYTLKLDEEIRTAVINRWARDGDWEHLISFFEEISRAYNKNTDNELAATLRLVTDKIRICFWSSPLIASSVENSNWMRPVESLAVGEVENTPKFKRFSPT